MANVIVKYSFIFTKNFGLIRLNLNKHLKDILMIVIGNIVMGLGYAKLMVPNQIINGGITSLSQIINHYIAVDIPTVNNVLLVVLLILTLLFLGKEVFLKSVLSSIAYSISFTLFFKTSITLTTTPVVDLVLASILISFGYYACLSSNSSTVGVDVIALIIKKYNNRTNISMIIRTLNYFILIIGLITFGVLSVIYGMIFSWIYSKELNYMLKHWTRSENISGTSE